MTSTLGQAAPVSAPPRRLNSPRPRRRARRSVIVGLVGLLAVVSTILVVFRGGSTSRVETFARLSSYHVTYTVTTPQLDDAPGSESTEQLWVRRPFNSVDITYDGAPPGTTPSLAVVYRLGVQVLKAATAQAGLLHVPAAAAPPDVRADVVVAAALRAHKLKVVGRAKVLGRACQVFRSAGSLRAGVLTALRSGATYVDTCIDGAGIVLRETQVSGGRTISDRRAVLVQTGDEAVAAAPFDMTGTATPYDSGGG